MGEFITVLRGNPSEYHVNSLFIEYEIRSRLPTTPDRYYFNFWSGSTMYQECAIQVQEHPIVLQYILPGYEELI